MPVLLPERVIEIPNDPRLAPQMCLTTGTTGAYVVLSYDSGDVEPPASLQNMEDSGLPVALDVHSLPRTVVDAIEITRRLGYRCLWTRDLCMLKGSMS